jgi:hypothetical protein
MEIKITLLTKHIANNANLIAENHSLLRKYFNILKQFLQSIHSQKANNAIKLMMGFPAQTFRQERENILNVLRKNIKGMSLKEYVDIIRHLNPDLINENYDIYADFLLELTENFEIFEKKVHLEYLLIMLRVFLRINRTEQIEKITNRILQVFIILFDRKITNYI